MIVLYIYITFTMLFMLGLVIAEPPEKISEFFVVILLIILSPIILPVLLGIYYERGV